MFQEKAGYVLLGITMMNDWEVLVDFDPEVPIVEITVVMHGLMSWEGNSVDVACTMSGKKTLLGMVQSTSKESRTATERVSLIFTNRVRNTSCFAVREYFSLGPRCSREVHKTTQSSCIFWCGPCPKRQGFIQTVGLSSKRSS